MTKTNKTPEQIVAAIIERGIDDVAQNMYGESISCNDDKVLEKLYLDCVAPIKALEKYLLEQYPDAFE